jgi:hypothetical protein
MAMKTFRTLRPIAIGGRVEAGELVQLDEEQARAYPPGFIQEVAPVEPTAAQVAVAAADPERLTGDKLAGKPSDISALEAAKEAARRLVEAGAAESGVPGDHVAGSIATLSAALADASATSEDAQDVVDAQAATLNTAIGAYDAAVVPVEPAV